MTTLQNWLDQKYSTKAEKAQIKVIGLGVSPEWKNLEGYELDLREFVGLEKIYIHGDTLKTPLKKINLTGLNNLKILDLGRNEFFKSTFPTRKNDIFKFRKE